MKLHLLKLAVGTTSLDDLRRRQSTHAAAYPPLRHRTRNFPRRAADILDGGSIYWVVNRVVCVRQRILDIAEGVRPDGARCTELMLDPALVAVQGSFIKPFQGWRYLDSRHAPPDMTGAAAVSDDLPEALRRDLMALALL